MANLDNYGKGTKRKRRAMEDKDSGEKTVKAQRCSNERGPYFFRGRVDHPFKNIMLKRNVSLWQGCVPLSCGTNITHFWSRERHLCGWAIPRRLVLGLPSPNKYIQNYLNLGVADIWHIMFSRFCQHLHFDDCNIEQTLCDS